MPKNYVIQTKDAEECDVFLGEREWKEHILERHPEIEPFLAEIEEAIKNPIVRYVDSEDERVNLHYYSIPEAKKPHQKINFLLVVIKYVNAPERNFEKTGFISSVYFIKDFKKRGRKERGRKV